MQFRLRQLVAELVKLTLFALAECIPKDENVWVFGAWFGQRYADNSKYFFEYLHKTDSSKKLVWISKNKQAIELVKSKGFIAYYFYSLKGLWLVARASVAIVCVGIASDLPSFMLSSKTKKVQLWHGIGPKGYAKKQWKENDKKIVNQLSRYSHYLQKCVLWYSKLLFKKRSKGMLWLPYTEIAYDLVITTSRFGHEKMKLLFGKSAKKIAITGYPRHDYLLTNRDKEFVPLYHKINMDKKRNKIICLYAPTHRSLTDFQLHIQLLTLDACLDKYPQISLLVQLHDFTTNKLQDKRIKFRNIHVINEAEIHQDIYTVLTEVSVLVTDYSSIYTDALLLNIPTIFMVADLGDYQKSDQSFLADYTAITAGPKVTQWPEVLEQVVLLEKVKKRYAKQRQNALKFFFAHQTATSNERCLKQIESLFKND